MSFHQVPLAEEDPEVEHDARSQRRCQVIRQGHGPESRWKAPVYLGVFTLLAAAMLSWVYLVPHVWSTASPTQDIELNVLMPHELIRWHCTHEESNLPMQILDRAKGSGPWDFDYLNVKTGKYERAVQLPQIKHEGFRAQKLNACAMNPMDDWIYCVVEVVLESNPKVGQSYIVRVGIADAETQTAGIHVVARVRRGSHYSGAFDLEGIYYFGPGRLYILPNLHQIKGHSFVHRHLAVDKTKIKSYKIPKKCKGADYAFWEREVDGEKQKLMWMLWDHTVSAIDVSQVPKTAPTCLEWKAEGLPKKVKGHFGAGWTFRQPDGQAQVYFAHNGGHGVWAIDNNDLDLNADVIHVYKAGDSEATNKNDGANCLSLSADSPFRATPPPRPPAKLPELPPKKEQPQEPANDEPEKLEDKEEPNKPTEPEKEAPKVNHEPVKPTEPEKEAPKVNHDPVKPTDPEKEEPEKEAPKPPEDPKGPANDEDPKKPDYDWVLMHDNTVCRRDKSDPIIWPHNKKLQTLTLAHICIVEPCTTVPKEIPLSLQDCQERCLQYEGGCHAVEYRSSESRCEILARTTEWFIDNTKHRTVPGPLDFECWLYKPPCDLLPSLRDHGAHSPSFEWAWTVCFFDRKDYAFNIGA